MEYSGRLTQAGELAEIQRSLVDLHLRLPACWSGLMRREVLGHAANGESRAFGCAYNALSLRAREKDWRPSIDELLTVNRLVGGDGCLRNSGLRVGIFEDFPDPGRLPDLLLEIFDHYYSSVELPVVRAVRLHLGIITVHPFRDANGRTARMIGSMCLIKSGYKSTLVGALEDIYARYADVYLSLLYNYWRCAVSEDHCVYDLTNLFLHRSMLLSFTRYRYLHLLQHRGEIGLSWPKFCEVDKVIEFEKQLDCWNQVMVPLLLERGWIPWQEVSAQLSIAEQLDLRDQLSRIRIEEHRECRTGSGRR